MRYCIFSDVHGNREAFEAVLGAVSSEGVDGYLFLGDVVGYGADPQECVKMLQRLKPVSVLAGNHEWGVLDLLDIGYFNEDARAAILWTRSVMPQEALEYMRSFELVRRDGDLILVHGSLDQPEEFNYVLDEASAALTLKLSQAPLCFLGHSHVSAFYHLDQGKAVYQPGPKIRCAPGNKYLINVGSVGQPRDGDPRAAYVIYDDKESVAEIKRVPYDIKTAQDKIVKAGLPPWLASRLTEGR